MAETSLSHSPGRPNPVLSRLLGRVGLLIAFALVLAGLVAFAGLGSAEAVLALALTGLVAAMLPGPQVQAEPPPLAVGEVGRDTQFVTAFADALIDPCLVLDRREVVVHLNAAAGNRFPNVVAGKPITFVLRNPELVQAIDLSSRNGETRTIELHETLPSETWEKVVVAPLKVRGAEWSEDDSRLLIVTFQSLTELKRVDAMRSDFIANASHELRTPLASLLGFIDTLLGPAARDAAAREKFLAIMRNQAERMSKLIDDLLSLSRIEMHQHVRPTGTTDLASLLREVRDGLQTQARAANVEVVLDMPECVANTMGDRSQLYEVFENLLDNAIKYGANGKTVEVELKPAARAGFQHLVTVTDHGPGVGIEHVPRLTERFYRIDADSSRKKKGTGLGLAIVKHTIYRHRGMMTIRSRPGEGMRVEVLLP